LAALRGRTYVIPDDVKYLTNVTLSHRIIPKAESSLRGSTAEQALREVIDSVPVPVENDNMTQ
jgi:MoxR-like ATPase